MNESQANRQLLAIMFTDVVGYTAITERNEADAVRIRDVHRQQVQSQVEDHGGELVDATGDESLSIFPSALHAVDCAIALQNTLRDKPDLQVRIGIHLGDVLRQNGEVIGEGVNVASRIRPLAEPGGICVSETVYQMIRSRAQVTARPLGPRTLKNVTQPVKVFALTSAEEAAAQAPAKRTRLRRRYGVAAALALVVFALLWVNRTPVLTWMALTVPRILGAEVEQQVGFAETRDGVKIAYATSGEGPPIVFVLGWITHLSQGIGSALYQTGYMADYSQDHMVVRYDGRGFGLSERNVSDFSIDARVQDLEAVVDALGLDRFVLYAFSAGGMTGVEYAYRHPERVSKLVLAGSWVDGSQFYGASTLKALTAYVRDAWPATSARAALVEVLAPESDAVERGVIMHFLDIAANGPQIAGFMESVFNDNRAAQARQLRVPTLVIASDADRTVPMDLSRSMAALIPDARLEILEGLSHIQACVADPSVVKRVRGFLADGR